MLVIFGTPICFGELPKEDQRACIWLFRGGEKQLEQANNHIEDRVGLGSEREKFEILY